MKFKSSFLWLTLITGNLFAQTPLQLKQIDSVMQLAHARGIFNGNILLAQKSRIIYEQSPGYAGGSKAKLLISAYQFDIGSVNKEFNGADILLLKQRGLSSLDDPVSQFLPELPEWGNRRYH